MDILEFATYKYSIPDNVSKASRKKYSYVIESDYAKYLAAISVCGGGAILNQFIELVRAMDLEEDLSYAGYSKRARNAISELEDMGFVETGYLNRNKYVLLKHPSVALAEGDYKTHKRVGAKELFKSDKFIASVTKLQCLIDYSFAYSYSDMFDQLFYVTDKLYHSIVKTDSFHGYDLELVGQILKLNDYRDVVKLLDDKPEHKYKLGVVRSLWDDVARLFRKLSLKGCLVSTQPLHLSIHTQEDGKVTLHYVPEIVIYDTYKGLDFYETQKSFLSDEFNSIALNNTINIRDNYIKDNTPGYKQYNRIGYGITLIGTGEDELREKGEVLNQLFNSGGIYGAMVSPVKYYCVDIDRYFNHSIATNGFNEIYDNARIAFENTIQKMVGDASGV